MISAEDARKITDKSYNEEIIDKISEKIEKAAKKGKYSIDINKKLSGADKNYLSKNGYNVFYNYLFSMTVISWGIEDSE